MTPARTPAPRGRPRGVVVRHPLQPTPGVVGLTRRYFPGTAPAAVDGEVEWVRDAAELADLLAGVEHALVRFTVAGVPHNAVWNLEDGAWVGLPG